MMDKKYITSIVFIVIACLLWFVSAKFLLSGAGLAKRALYLVQAVMFYVLGATMAELNYE